MMDLPLHPALVHLPLGLAFVLPLFATLVFFVSVKNKQIRLLWVGVFLMNLLIFVGGFAAMQTGEGEEDYVEQVVAHDFIHEHEERAEGFVYFSAILLGIGLLTQIKREKPAQFAKFAYVLGTFALLMLAYRVGHSGGSLVYKYGAARMYELKSLPQETINDQALEPGQPSEEDDH